VTKKIAIMCGGDWKNSGNLIMTQNFISYICKQVKDIEFIIFESSKTQLARDTIDIVLSGLDVDITYSHQGEWEWKNTCRWLRRLGMSSEIVSPVDKCDAVVFLGGDHFIGRHCSYWSGIQKWIYKCCNIINLKQKGKKIYIVSQSVGSFPYYLKPLIKMMFKCVDGIYCRDTAGVRELKKIGIVDNVTLTYDLGFLPLHNEITDRYKGSIKGDYVTFTVSDLFHAYSDTIEEHAYKLTNMIHTLHDVTKLPVYVMVHSCNIDEQELVCRLFRMTNNPNIYYLPPSYPLQTRYILGSSKLNVSMRMHATISSLEQGVPSLPISNTSDKSGGPKNIRYTALYHDLKLTDRIVGGLNHDDFKKKLKDIWQFNDVGIYPLYIETHIKPTIKKAMIPINDIAKEMNK